MVRFEPYTALKHLYNFFDGGQAQPCATFDIQAVLLLPEGLKYRFFIGLINTNAGIFNGYFEHLAGAFANELYLPIWRVFNGIAYQIIKHLLQKQTVAADAVMLHRSIYRQLKQ